MFSLFLRWNVMSPNCLLTRALYNVIACEYFNFVIQVCYVCGHWSLRDFFVHFWFKNCLAFQPNFRLKTFVISNTECWKLIINSCTHVFPISFSLVTYKIVWPRPLYLWCILMTQIFNKWFFQNYTYMSSLLFS